MITDHSGRMKISKMIQKFSEPARITIYIVLLLGIFLFFCVDKSDSQNPLAGKTICIDAGHGGTADSDSYRVGPTGEREEWIDLRVALILRDLLEKKCANVIMTRTEDKSVPLKDRADLAVANDADAFLSIHHNATADPEVNFPIIYFHGNASENQASVLLGKCLADRLSEALFDSKSPVSLVSDHTIFPNAGTAVLRHSYGIPGVIAEASFFTNPAEEERLKSAEYNHKEAEAYLQALEDYFSSAESPIREKYSNGKVPPFQVFQEAERMNEIAKKWRENFVYAEKLFHAGHSDSMAKALELFTLSAKSFPDSWLAGKCHSYRAQILEMMGRTGEAKQEMKRVEEFYVNE